MSCQIVIDTRERDLLTLLPEAESKSLDVGDVCLVFKDIKMVIERKTIADLAASIKDGRYAEQKQRLHACQAQNDIVVIVIEGRTTFNPTKSPTHVFGMSRKAIISAILHMQLRDGFHVIQTESTLETSNLIIALSERIDKYDKQHYERNLTFDKKYEPCVVKTVKKENNDKQTAFLQQLCTIPLVSLKTAEVIVKNTGATCMAEFVPILTYDSKIAGIGNAISESIVEYMGIVRHCKTIGDFFQPLGESQSLDRLATI